MAIEFNCGTCGSLLRVGDEHAGKQAKCPQCTNVNTIPYESQPTAATPAQPPQPQQQYAAPMTGQQGHQHQPVAAPYGMPHGSFQPDRGGLILALGIIGLLVCCIPGVFAWIMGKGDMKKIKAGVMNPQGESLTQVGMILGIVSTVLWGIGILIYVGVFAVFVVAAGAQGM